jgi:hypothetical protein
MKREELKSLIKEQVRSVIKESKLGADQPNWEKLDAYIVEDYTVITTANRSKMKKALNIVGDSLESGNPKNIEDVLRGMKEYAVIAIGRAEVIPW